MARYIDADKLIAHLKNEIKGCEIPFGSRANGKGIAYGTTLGLKSAISFAETLSTADVAPKSEVEKLEVYIDDLNDSKEHLCVMLEEAKADVAREIFEEIYEDCFDQFGYINYEALAELKKKYTEEQI